MIDDLVFLAQSDTTVGFLSHNRDYLFRLKNRNPNKSFLQVSSSLSNVASMVRVPNKYKNLVRRSKKSTFLYSNKKAIRKSFDLAHNRFLSRYSNHSMFFSTSANLSGCKFDIEFATSNCDIALYQKNNFLDTQSSSLYKINNYNIKKIR